MPKATTRYRKGQLQIPKSSPIESGTQLQPRKRQVSSPAIQSNRSRPVPEPPEVPQLRRSSRLVRLQSLVPEAENNQESESTLPKPTRGRKLQQSVPARTKTHQPKPTSVKLPNLSHSGPLIKRSNPAIFKDASTQPKPPAYRDASTQIPEAQNQLSSTIQPWLEALAPHEPPEVQHNLKQLYMMRASAAVPSSGVVPSGTIGTGTYMRRTTARRAKQLRANQSSLAPLEDKDNVTQNLEKALKRKKELSETELKGLLDILSKCIADSKGVRKDSERYELFETFRENLNEALPPCRLFTLTEKDFKKDQIRCMNSNEALLQRTILFNSTDRWRIEDHFIIDAEDAWAMAPKYRLLDAGEDTAHKKLVGANAPRPDLAIFFKFNKICSPESKESNLSEYIDGDLRTCVHPDGNYGRCFPFLFIEAKRRNDSLDLALLDSTLAANQALQNIYSCMEKAGTTEDFDKVRVFSIGINASHHEIRVHFARLDQDFRTLFFFFYTVDSGELSLGDSLNRAIRNMLQGYASTKLLPMLQRTFKRLMHAVSRKRLGYQSTLDRFGANALDGIPESDSESESDTTVSSVEEDRASARSGNSQRQESSNGRRQRPNGDQQGRAASKRPKRAPAANPSPATPNEEAVGSLGASQLDLVDKD